MSADLLNQQYELLKGSRQVLFDYCEKLSIEEFTKEMPQFGHGSIRNLFTHIADVYIHWLQNFALSRLTPYPDPSDIKQMSDVHRIFTQADQCVEDFIKHFGADVNKEITAPIPQGNKTLTTTPLTLFSHVLTHEFHHKGQILSMSRQLGYTPVDTDMIRT
ncbi:DinB family protein [Mucilaginibacter sp. AW1-3]